MEKKMKKGKDQRKKIKEKNGAININFYLGGVLYPFFHFPFFLPSSILPFPCSRVEGE